MKEGRQGRAYIEAKRKMTTHTLKTTLSILCIASFLNGCLATQEVKEVKVDNAPNQHTRKRLTNGEQPLNNAERLPSRMVQFQSVTQAQPTEKRQSTTPPQFKEQLQLMYLNYLKKEGYVPELDSDGDVKFKKEGYGYFIDISAQERDPHYLRIIFPNFWSIDNDLERLEVLAAADYVNSDIKVVKLYTVKDNVWATVEIFLANKQDFKEIFPRLMSVLSGGIESFAKKMKQIRKQTI